MSSYMFYVMSSGFSRWTYMYMPTQRQERTPPALMDTTKITLAGPMMAGDDPSCVGGSSYQPNMKWFVDVCRRKFRSQTSDNMDRWKSRGGKSQRREEKRRREDQRRERVRGKKMQVREKVEKSRNTAFFHWFVSPEARNVNSLKRRVRSHLARWEM